MRAALAPLSYRPFRYLFAGRLTSLAGGAIAPIALLRVWLAVGVYVVSQVSCLFVRDVRRLERTDVAPVAVADHV